MLDASALVALLREESGADQVERLLDGAYVSAVNWSEVVVRHRAVDLKAEELREGIEALGVRIVAFGAEDAELTAELREPTRGRGLSLADRACLALAGRLGGTAFTADRAWTGLDVGVPVVLIR